MNNAFSRIGRTCASMVFGGALIATALFAAPQNTITVTLPHAVTVGSTTLPSGQYTLSAMDMNDGIQYFVVRGAKTSPVTLQAQKIDATDAATQVILSKEGNSWHFDRLFVEGESVGYEFAK